MKYKGPTLLNKTTDCTRQPALSGQRASVAGYEKGIRLAGIEKLLKLGRAARAAKEETAAGYFRQLRELSELMRAPNLLGPEEYFEYRLFDPQLPMERKREFIGYKGERVYSKLNLSSWDAAANDKIVYEQIMLAAGLRIPRTLAIVHPWRIAGPHCRALRNEEDVHDFLAHAAFPLFAKPVHGLFGRGTMVIQGYDALSQTLLDRAGQPIHLTQFQQWLAKNSREGILLQAMLVPSAAIRHVCGERLSSVRILVLCDDTGPSLFRANWKLCTGDNFVDNTDGWKNGNIVAAVDHNTGQVTAAYRGTNGKRTPTSEHPDTKAPLVGIQVPDWDALVGYVQEAARCFPGLRFQAWDIAATSEGPCAIELNLATFHTVHATQLVSGLGFLDSRFTRALASV